MVYRSHRISTWPVLLVLAAISAAGRVPSANAYTPEHPEVTAMISKGIAFLEKSKDLNDGYQHRLGGECLTALAIYKWTKNADHPLVKVAINACRSACESTEMQAHDNYSVGIALIFLCDLDPVIHRRQVDVLLNVLLRRQKNEGGWGYPDKPTGDTSQTQYAALGTWMAARQGIEVPLDAKERLANWLIRVQDPNGSYGYQGVDPGVGNYQRVQQSEQRLSLHAAAMGSLYIATEMLGFVTIDENRGNEKKSNTLPALQKRTDRKRSGPLTDKVPVPALRQALADGNRYQTMAYKPDCGQYQYYYMYGLERYLSFKELAEGTKEKEPRWYNDGVNFLRANQKPDGSWSRDYYGPVLETSFATLFLMRSTQITIQRIVESGRLKAGQGLPDDLTEIRETNSGKIISTKDAPTVDDVLALLEDESSPVNDYINGMPEKLELSNDPAERVRQLDRLRRLAVSGSFQARLTSINTISRLRDLDNVPALIYAITDPDVRIARTAFKGLQFISRRFDAPPLAEDATPQRKQEVANNWKAWYLSVRPEGLFIE